jgi:hypothetical protein
VQTHQKSKQPKHTKGHQNNEDLYEIISNSYERLANIFVQFESQGQIEKVVPLLCSFAVQKNI